MCAQTPCLAGPQPQGFGPSPGPLLAVFIHTVECKIDGPLNYRLQNFALLQIFEVKFANIYKANFEHENYFRPSLFTQGSKNKCL